ncbi:hypothetical protein [Bradyrhizobium stylosanthis]|uniref:Uncharacterized protein n=1 Tax=Bradyrhizobium stylosanthis TaxID=1803665 RepID=A0A560CXG5_9BRAD|nr:hypothetical protein [Bradyrhizobium stylosanthis]TWA89554.1 hypothetical protein FBZ96_11922 [Bradyrhizobium stylosanthis]
MPFGKFIFECDTDNFDDAVFAARELMESSEKSCMITSKVDGRPAVCMFGRKLKRSISVKQVKP